MSQLKAQVDKLLTDVSLGYFPDGYIASQVLPFKAVKQKSGLIGEYGQSHLRIERSLVGGRGKYRRVEAIVRGSETYLIESHGLEGLVTEDDYRNVEQPFEAESDETEGLTSMILLEKEKVLADAMTSTAVLTQNTTLGAGATYDEYNSSDPIGDFRTAREAVYAGCGLPPNRAVMDWLTFNALAYHPGILDALGFTQARAGQLNPTELAKAMGVEELLIGSVCYNSAAEGAADSLDPVWGDNIIFYRAPKKAGKKEVSLGLQLGFADQRRVFKNPENNPPNSTSILVDDHYDWVFANVGAGYLIKNTRA